MPLLQEGQIIRDTYEVERFLGEGAFAEVFRVKHRFLGRQATKVFKRGGMTIKEIEDMLGEAIMLSRLGHPNIVRVFDANVLRTEHGLYGFFTMENVPGGSLEKFWHSPHQEGASTSRAFYNEPVIAAGSESCEGKGRTTCSRNGMKAVRSRTSSWNLSSVLRWPTLITVGRHDPERSRL
jgi:serine/threonine protein kinase